MKSSASTKKISRKTVTRRAPSRSPLTTLGKSTKRYAKQTLRDLLLSKTFSTSFKVLIGLMVTGSALYGAYALIGNTFGNDIVVSKSEILARVSKHTELPAGEPDAVVRVQDADTLKKEKDFFENVKVGDYVIMYPKMAIIYDLRNDAIVALKRSDR